MKLPIDRDNSISPSIKKFECSICKFETNTKSEFSEHISFPFHIAAMQMLQEKL